MARETMICSNDGTPMICHAEKPTDPRTAEEARQASLGVMIEEVHRCPKCGNTASRRIAL